MHTLQDSKENIIKFVVLATSEHQEELFLVFGPVSEDKEGFGDPIHKYYFSEHYDLNSTTKFQSNGDAQDRLNGSIDGHEYPDAEILEVLKNDGGEWILKDDKT